MPTFEAVFVSPHLDDAVFSCAAEIARCARAGAVLVLNVFTRYPNDVKLRGIVFGADRHAEERAAADHLRYTFHNLDELDAYFRQPEYRSIGNIFRAPVRNDVEAFLPRLRGRLFEFLEGHTYRRLYVPLGVGWHVDHILTHRVFDEWPRRGDLLYYEDAPYSLFPNATKYRIGELARHGAEPADRTLRPGSALAEWWQTARAYSGSALISNLRPSFIRPFASIAVGAYLLRLMSNHRERQLGSCRAQATELRRDLDEEALDGKVSAAMLYRSQFREFFHDRSDCAHHYTEYARAVGVKSAALERFWKIEV
jgi:hypothetical protein